MNFFKRILRILLQQKPPHTDNGMLEMLYQRKSCRKFLSRPVGDADISRVVDAGRLSPSTVNLQTWSFFPFSAEQWREKFSVPIPFGARAAVIVAADLKRLAHVSDRVSEYPLFFYTLAVMNASIAAMNMSIAIETLGMKSIMLSQTGRAGLVDHDFLKEKLGLPELVFPLTTVAFGYPAEGPLFSPPKLGSGVTVHRDRYHFDEEGFMEWYGDMDLACRMSEKEKLTEKFDKYLKLLPDAEKELQNAFAKIKN